MMETPKTERFSCSVKKRTKLNRNYAKSLDFRLLSIGNSRILINLIISFLMQIFKFIYFYVDSQTQNCKDKNDNKLFDFYQNQYNFFSNFKSNFNREMNSARSQIKNSFNELKKKEKLMERNTSQEFNQFLHFRKFKRNVIETIIKDSSEEEKSFALNTFNLEKKKRNLNFFSLKK